jgi:putative ABC transport system permease protein
MYRVIAKIARASLVRRRSRSVLVVLMISVSLWGLLLMEGIYDGMTEQMIDNVIRSDSGHISVFHSGYRLDPDIHKLILADIDITSLLNSNNKVASFTKRIKQDGLIATAQYSKSASIIGIELDAEKRHGQLHKYIINGDYGFGSKNKGAIIGSRLAAKLKLTIGNKVIISGQDSANEVSAIALKISGIIKTNNMALDQSSIFIDIQKARELLSIPVGVSQFSISLHSEESIANLKDNLQENFPKLEIFSWDELYPALMQGRVVMRGFIMVMGGIVFCVAGMGIFGVMLVSVIERFREFGIMLAVGTKFSQITQIVLTESLLLGLSGYIVGILLGGLTLLYFKYYGLDLSIFGEGLETFGIDSITYAIIRPSYFTYSFAAILISSLFSTLLPLRVLKKAKPIEAIRMIG